MPTYFKDMGSYPVLLTKTTEEELKEHFKKASELYMERIQPDIDEQRRLLKMLYNENPYKQRNWRKGKPERLYENGFDRHQLKEEDAKGREWKACLWRDFRWCIDVYEWKEDWVVPFDQMMRKAHEIYKNNVEEIKHMDLLCFEIAKRNWEVEDAVWIAKQKLKKSHEDHKPKSYWRELFATDKKSEEWYNGVIPDNEDTCEFCMEEKRISDERDEKMRLEDEEQEREEEEKRLKREEERKQRKAEECKEQTCELCDYTSNYTSIFDLHMTSREHLANVKQQKLYCTVCEYQCRNQMEHAHHIGTNKHKKKAGLVSKEPVEFVCLCCEYTSQFKQHYENHMKSKKHQKKMDEQKASLVNIQ